MGRCRAVGVIRVILIRAIVAAVAVLAASAARADAPLPELTQPVHDLAGVIDPAAEAEIDRMSRALQAASGDVVVVVTVASVEPYADVREYAVRLFENHGRGIGSREDNGVLIVLALRERSVRIEVGYGLEGWITDGYAGETSRQVMVPEFRAGRYAQGLVAGTARIVGRIAEARNVTLTGVEVAPPRRGSEQPGLSLPLVIMIFLLIALLSRGGGGPRRGVRRWGHRGWSGWSSGVGPFGAGWGGRGSGGGGFGGGFGGFGGGRSGGGGGGASW